MGAHPQEVQPAFRHVRTLKGHTRAVSAAKFSPGASDGETSAWSDAVLLATASADASVKVWQPGSGQELQSMEGHARGISDVAWHPGGRVLATASDDANLKLWDVETGACLRTLAGHSNYVFCCSFSPHGHLLVSGSFDETLRVWDVRTSTSLREVPAHSDPITAVDFSCDGTLIVSSSLDGLCRVWETRTSHCLKTLFDKDSPPVSHVQFTPNGRYLLSSSLDGRLRLWDYVSGKAIKSYRGHKNEVLCIPGALCAPGSAQGTLEEGHCAQEAQTPPAPWVVAGSEDGNIFVYGLKSQKVLQVISGEQESGRAHSDAVLAVAVHPHAPVIVSCGHQKDTTIKLWQHQPEQ